MCNKVCQNCKFWEREKDFDAMLAWRNGKMIESKSKVGTCSNSAFVYKEETQTPENGLGYWDAESYSASFETGQNFGCIHFAEKQ